MNFAPTYDAFLRRRPMLPDQIATSKALARAGVVGLERNADGLIDLGPDSDDNGGRILGTLRGWRVSRFGSVWLAVSRREGVQKIAETLSHVVALAWLEGQENA